MKQYLAAARPYSFTAAVVPVLIGTASARLVYEDLQIDVLHFLLVLLGSLFAQVVCNIINDIVDKETGLDNESNYGRENCLVKGLITHQEAKGIIFFAGVGGILIGLSLSVRVGVDVLVLTLLGIFLAIEYTAPPLKLKYKACGDIAVLVAFGFAITLGSFICQTYSRLESTNKGPLIALMLDGRALTQLILLSLPNAILVCAILHANNHRDRITDAKHGARTLANILSPSLSKSLLICEVCSPFVLVLVLIFTGCSPSGYSIAVLFVAVIPASAILNRIRHDHYDGDFVPMVAQLHGMVGILVTISITAVIVSDLLKEERR